MHGRGTFKGWTDEALRAYVTHALKDVDAGVALKCQPSLEARIFTAYPKRLWSSLPKVVTPTLVLHGKTTYPFVGQSAARWHAMNPVASEQQVAGGHCFMQEFPADSAKRVREFLLRSA